MTTHTQGPWLVTLDPTFTQELAIEARVDGVTVHIALVHGVGTDEQTQANAALIVTSPEMLAKLKEIAGECDGCNGHGVVAFEYPLRGLQVGDPCPVCEELRTLIAKAEGRPS